MRYIKTSGIESRGISLRDEISDAIAENLPRSDEMDSFCKSKDYERMLNDCLEVVDSHARFVLDEAIAEISK